MFFPARCNCLNGEMGFVDVHPAVSLRSPIAVFACARLADAATAPDGKFVFHMRRALRLQIPCYQQAEQGRRTGV